MHAQCLYTHPDQSKGENILAPIGEALYSDSQPWTLSAEGQLTLAGIDPGIAICI